MKIEQQKLNAVMEQVANDIYKRNYESLYNSAPSYKFVKFFKSRKELSKFELSNCSGFIAILQDLKTDGVEGLNTFDDIMQLMRDKLNSSSASSKIAIGVLRKYVAGERYPGIGFLTRNALVGFVDVFFSQFEKISCDPRVAEFRKSTQKKHLSNNAEYWSEWSKTALPNAEPPRQPLALEPNVAVQVPAQIVRAFGQLRQTNIPIIQQELDKLVQLDQTMRNQNFDETLLCPINQSLMIEPVMVIESENTYERSAILSWFETNNTDPCSGRQLSNKTIASNGAVKRIILAELQRLYTAAEARKNLVEEDIPAPQEVPDTNINQLEATGESRVGLLDNTDLGVNDAAPAMNAYVRRLSI